jgi:hypothetical protein
MKRLVLFGLTASAACAAFAGMGDVIASFPAPANYPIALAVAANYNQSLWVFCNTSPYRIYRVNGMTGSVFASFISPQGSYTRGLTYSYDGGGGLPTGSYLWMGNYSTDRIYRCNPGNGSAYASIPANHDMFGGLAVMATAPGGGKPSYMFSSDTSPRCIYRQSLTNGSIYASFAPSPAIFDLAWDYQNRYVWSGNAGSYVYAFLTQGSIAGSFRMRADNPRAFAYTSSYLWVGTTTGSHYIWMLHCPCPWGPVEPASLGRVKALFK